MTYLNGAAVPFLLDVTLRDGGYVNGHSWALADAISIAGAAADAGVPDVEVGYLRPERHTIDGATKPSASCPAAYLDSLREATPAHVSLVAMAHQKDVPLTTYREVAARGVDMVRLPTKLSTLAGLRAHVEAIHEAGMQAAVNLIRISELTPSDIARAATTADEVGANVIYLADSNGSLFPQDVADLLGVVREQTDRNIGFHAHDGLSLAFSNSLAALESGCTYLDASLGGMGKGGGNLSLELVSGYLRTRHDAPISIAPLAHTTAEVLAAWRSDGLSRCDSIVSSLLNLNLDDIASMRGETGRTLLTLLDRRPEPAIT